MRNTLTRKKILARTTTVAPALLLASLALLPIQFPQVIAEQSGRQADNKKAAPAAQSSPLLKRMTTRREIRRFGYGGTVTVYGAPEGSITVEAWPKSEVEVTAEVEQSAGTEEELTQLAAVNSFLLDEDMNHLRITSVGVHDRKYMKRVARDFPKKLLAMPWKIDYHIRVPAACDLEIYAGRGALTLEGVEGAVRLSKPDEGATSFNFAGGDVEATLRGGPVVVHVPTRSWRGRGMSVRVASGDLTVELPAGFSGDVNAEVLRVGRIENSFAGLTPRERTQATERSLQGRAGQGGAILSFTVGDGTLRIVQGSVKQKAESGKP
jgi:hypothetical protein